MLDFSLVAPIGQASLAEPDGYLPVDNFAIKRGLFSGILFGEEECGFDKSASKERDVYAFGLVLAQMEFGRDLIFTEEAQSLMTNFQDRNYCRKYRISKVSQENAMRLINEQQRKGHGDESFYEEAFYEFLKHLISTKKQVRLEAFYQLQEFYRQHLAAAEDEGPEAEEAFNKLMDGMRRSVGKSSWFAR